MKSLKVATVYFLANCAVWSAVQATPADDWQKFNDQGIEAYQQGRYSASLRLQLKALKLAEKNGNYKQQSTTLDQIGTIYEVQGLNQKAQTLLARALSTAKKCPKPDPEEIASITLDLAQNNLFDRKVDTAARLVENAKSLLPMNRSATINQNIQLIITEANVRAAQGNQTGAIKLLEDALSLEQRESGTYSFNTAELLRALAPKYADNDQLGKAETAAKRAMPIIEKQVGKNSPSIQGLLNDLATVYSKQGKHEKAEASAQEALKISQIEGNDNPASISCLDELVSIYEKAQKFEQSLAFQKKAIVITETTPEYDKAEIAFKKLRLADIFKHSNREKQAELAYLEAIKYGEINCGLESIPVAGCLNNLGNLYLDQGNSKKGQHLVERALAILTKQCPEGDEHLHLIRTNLSVVYYDNQDYGKTEEMLRKCVESDKKIADPNSSLYAEDLTQLASFCSFREKYSEAKELFRKALREYKRLKIGDDELVATCLEKYAACLRSSDDYLGAEIQELKAREIRSKLSPDSNAKQPISIELALLILVLLLSVSSIAPIKAWKQNRYKPSSPSHDRIQGDKG